MRERQARRQYDALAAAMKAAVGDLREVCREAVAEALGDIESAKTTHAKLDEARACIVALADKLKTAESGRKWAEELCAEVRKQLDIERAGMTIIVQERDKALGELEAAQLAVEVLEDQKAKALVDLEACRVANRSHDADGSEATLRFAKLSGDYDWAVREMKKHASELRLANQRVSDLMDEIERLKAELAKATSGRTSPATSPDKSGEEKVMIGQVLTGQRETMRLTGLAERIHELAAKGWSDRGICDQINARKSPPEWLNAAGVAAIREMLG